MLSTQAECELTLFAKIIVTEQQTYIKIDIGPASRFTGATALLPEVGEPITIAKIHCNFDFNYAMR